MHDEDRASNFVHDTFESESTRNFAYLFDALSAEHPLSVVVVSRHRRFAAIRGAVLRDLVEIVQRAPAHAALEALFERCRARRVVPAQAHSSNADTLRVDIRSRPQIVNARPSRHFGVVATRQSP